MSEKTTIDVQLKALEVLEAQADAVKRLAGTLGHPQLQGVAATWNPGEFKVGDDGTVRFVLKSNGEELDKEKLIVCGRKVLVEYELTEGKKAQDPGREKLLNALDEFLKLHGVAHPVAYLAGTCSHRP